MIPATSQGSSLVALLLEERCWSLEVFPGPTLSNIDEKMGRSTKKNVDRLVVTFHKCYNTKSVAD